MHVWKQQQPFHQMALQHCFSVHNTFKAKACIFNINKACNFNINSLKCLDL